ncbi:type II toxin-antitoxin system PemK/MazF family toxin [Pseudarthrobacter phenanthrenivorans]|uniref:Type II toxin-antitoxin system PemK/MazF family toxin n=1 Tax=Pseudarthrobacter phenanthrenivorans TaxID=361575 RepID=A0A3B0FEC8_PSEPS|nr:type II toxin-antitoxin system PemK/MazF family toxin [Pseudarthrobacter phenanthrenivorans]RKO21303.1 type II toxin-antitoxin system PemK/MazF family toxin [Pseudarthrobacter phenanthrenivorans]
MVFNLRSLQDAVRTGLRALQRAAGNPAPPIGRSATGQRAPGRPAFRRPAPGRTGPAAVDGEGLSYPGDFQGRVPVRYAPRPDGAPDPGEVVWAWVPYEEDHGRGKDRPVLLVGRSDGYLLGLMLTSRDRVSDSVASADYIDVGTGDWDRQGRPSEARLDRILRLRPESIRREGAVLDRARFEKVASGLRRRHGWN